MTLLRIALLVALQTVALVYMIVDRQIALRSPHVVTLKVVPVDPRDMFRGDYVTLNYDISTIDTRIVKPDRAVHTGETVYVVLHRNPKDGTWQPTALRHDLPTVAEGEVALQGKVNWRWGWDTRSGIDYGVESYYVPEGTGHAIEDEARKGGISVDVAVDDRGKGVIKALRRNGKAFYVEGLF
jgi:uncharacterized membrane-anchored protein